MGTKVIRLQQNRESAADQDWQTITEHAYRIIRCCQALVEDRTMVNWARKQVLSIGQQGGDILSKQNQVLRTGWQPSFDMAISRIAMDIQAQLAPLIPAVHPEYIRFMGQACGEIIVAANRRTMARQQKREAEAERNTKLRAS